ncbi:VWA domain-containing protein [Pararhizobium haloflavum]|uniref:VWA domain-containing protein n=1 Tax=Pararhizobium haloflavum TaxID=2037914 RepID=UPI001AED09EB|nr:VWA domain-containing protein [Pararhizobium haloflavum]
MMRRLDPMRLREDRRGNFAVLGAIVMVPVVGAVGLAADYSEILRTRSHIAEALDAAAFVAADGYAKKRSGAAITQDSAAVFRANLDENGVSETVVYTYDGFFTGEDANFIRVRAQTQVQPRFMPVLWAMLDKNGLSQGGSGEDGEEGNDRSGSGGGIDLGLKSEVAVATSTVELALVLDNSGSMDGNKLKALKSAASKLVEDLHGAVAPNSEPNAVQFAIVPFAGAVNVGPGNKSASWMDTAGKSSIHHENFDWTTLSGASKQNGVWKKNGKVLNRFWLFDEVSVDWGGCVEARPYPLNVDDTAPSAGNPDSYFVPMFAPDTPTRYKRDGKWESWYTNSYIEDDFLGRSSASNQDSSYHGAAQHARQSWMRKYEQTGRVSNQPISVGPNYACTSIPIMPLTASRRDALEHLDDMRAEGATSIAEGAAWGLRTLSPGEPFTGGRAYGSERNIKAMVVMSDGENTYYTDNNRNESTYGPYGFSANGRIFDGTDYHRSSDFSRAMDSHLLKVCEAAKAKSIMVFTIAFDVDNRSPVKALLERCASLDRDGKPNYYNATSNKELETAFGMIGSKVSGVRLYR